MLAQVFQATLLAFRFSSYASVASMQYEPMMRNRYQTIRNMFRQFHLHTIWCGTTCRNQTYTMTHAKHMSVNGKGSLAPHNRLYYISRLTPHTWQFHQFFQRIRNFATKVLHQHPCHAYQVTRFIVRIRNTLYIFIYNFRCG